MTHTTTTELKLPNRSTLTPGVEFRVKGQRGRFSFVSYVQTEAGKSWVWGYGGDKDPRGRRRFRAFRAEDIRRIHRDRTLRGKHA